MPGARYTQLAERAADRFGYVTRDDARDLGVPMDTLSKLAARGQLEHVGHGVYRVSLIPPSPLGPYMEATLWPYGVPGVISHESALSLYEMSDVSPNRIHLTVPPEYRTHRAIPDLYVLHRERLTLDQLSSFEGIPIVTAATAARQCLAQHLRRSLLEQAVDAGVEHGWLRRHEAAALRREIAER
jgi:predicted transcriptional regulator of viral defense system